MTGIERLRAIAGAWDEWGLGGTLAEIADQIERERACDADTIENIRLILLRRCKEFGVDTSDCEDGEDVLNNLIETLRPRIMPEGMEWLIEAWPKFEDDAPVKLGDMSLIDGDADMVEAVQIWIHGKPVICGDNGSQQLEKGERVRRPAPAVLASDGEPLEVGQTVWDTDAEADTPLTVVEVSSDLVRCEYTWKDGKTYRPCYPPDQLTHTKPEPIDTWQRIEEDARGLDSGVDRELFTHTHEDIVRRCKALAERERSE